MRKSSVLLGVISVACATSAAWSLWQLRAERNHSATLEQRLAAFSTQNAAAETRASPTVSQSVAVAASTAILTPVPEPTPATVISKRDQELVDHIRNLAEREREMLRDPAYRQVQKEQARRQWARTYADAIRVVGMTPEQADRIVDMQVEGNIRFTEMGGSTGQPLSEEMQTELKRAGEAEQAELRRLLGEDKYERWQRYQASGEERAEVGQFRMLLSTTAEPLHDSQADALVEAIYSERQRRSREYEDYVKSVGITDRYVVAPEDRQRWLDLEKEANQRIHDTMAGSLSHAQLASLDEELVARLAPVEAALRMQLEGKLAKSD